MNDIFMENPERETVVFGGGCFWCTEAVFKMLKGISSVESGYAGGDVENPIYEEVATGKTGHAEVVKIEYDSNIVSFNELLTVFFATHDPTTINRQGKDIGPQYRSIILYTSPDQKLQAKKFIKELNQSSKMGGEITTEVQPLGQFFKAEKSHQDYYKNHPEAAYCQVVINPKLEKVKEKFANLLNKLH